MQEYEIRRGHFPEIDGGKIENILKEVFGKFDKKEDGSYETSFGALARLYIKIKDKKTLLVETTMNPKVDERVASETIKKYNAFLEAATGFTAKERSKRLQKKAKEGEL
ncbi:MAG: DUF5611 family protein [Thermoplasmata archaeon]